MRRRSLLGITAVMFALAGLSLTLTGYNLVLATRICTFAIFAMSLDLLVGYLGLSSLGHAAFFGIAAYAVGFLSKSVTTNLAVILVASVVTSALLAAVFGALALRSKGVYFMMLTLALAQVAWGIALKWRSVTGGEDGLPGIPRPWIGAFQLGDPGSFYLFALALLAVCATLMILLVNSPFGLALQGIRESPTRMRALGYDIWLHQFITFVIAGAFAGVAGAIFAMDNGITSPSAMGIVTGAEALLMVLLGGAGTVIGPILGAIVIVLLEFVVSAHTDRWQTVLGLIYISVVILAPRGIYPPIRDALRWVVTRRRGTAPAAT